MFKGGFVSLDYEIGGIYRREFVGVLGLDSLFKLGHNIGGEQLNIISIRLTVLLTFRRIEEPIPNVTARHFIILWSNATATSRHFFVVQSDAKNVFYLEFWLRLLVLISTGHTV